MRMKKNENGYALVTVLLITLILMIVCLSVVSQSFNTTNQNQVVEKDAQSVAIAEMGVTYYQTLIQNVYNTNQNTFNDQVRSDTTLKTNQDYADKAANLMYNAIKQELANQTSPMPVEGKQNAYFKINSVTYDDSNYKIIIKVDGVEKNKTTTLSTTMTIAPVVTGASQSGETPPPLSLTIAGVLTGFNNITNLGILCINPSSLSLETPLNLLCNNATSALLTGDKTYNGNQNNKTLSNKTYYSQGNLTINGNMNNLKNVKIHSDESLDITGNANSSSGGLIETATDASFGGQLGLDSSKMYIGGNLIISDRLVLSNNSTVFVDKDATIEKNLTVDSTSTLCVAGHLQVGGQIKGSANIILSSDPNFQTKCKPPANQTVVIDWSQQLFSNVNYGY